MLISQMLERSQKAYEDGKALLANHPKGVAVPAELDAQVNAFFDDADSWQKRADRAKALEDQQKKSGEGLPTLPLSDSDNPGRKAGESDKQFVTDAEKAAVALTFKKYLRGKFAGMEPKEMKKLSTMNDPDGGIVVLEDFRMQLITKLNELLKIRARCTKISTKSQSVGFPTFDFDPDVDETVQENEEISEVDITDILGKTSFTPHKRARIFRVPMELVEDEDFDLTSLLVREFARAYAELEERDLLTGNGVGKALGLLSVSITGRAVTGASNAAIAAEDIIDLSYDLSEVYRSQAVMLMHRNTIRQIRKIRDLSGGANTGLFMWQPSFQAGEPATLNGFPIIESEFFPDNNTTAGSATPLILFGDLTDYWIVDRKDLSVQRLDEKYAEYDQIGYKLRKRMDAAPVRLTGFRRLNCKT